MGRGDRRINREGARLSTRMTRFPPLDIRHPQPGDIVSDEVNVAGFINVGDAVVAVSVRAEDGSCSDRPSWPPREVPGAEVRASSDEHR
jgi:hypothetical protein